MTKEKEIIREKLNGIKDKNGTFSGDQLDGLLDGYKIINTEMVGFKGDLGMKVTYKKQDNNIAVIWPV